MAYGIDRALNPLKYCIITPNLFCSGHSSSPSNTAPTQDGPRFPSISYYDNINAQDKLISEYFGITNPLMYIGFSMGAQQAFHWGRYMVIRPVVLFPYVEPQKLQHKIG